MGSALIFLSVYGSLCGLCGFLFYSGHPVAGAWALVIISFTSVRTKGDK